MRRTSTLVDAFGIRVEPEVPGQMAPTSTAETADKLARVLRFRRFERDFTGNLGASAERTARRLEDEWLRAHRLIGGAS